MKDGGTVDLHKRIVGTRYLSAGLSPYFYKWKQGDAERLCIPSEAGSSFKQNVVTLAPSYMWLLQPLAQLQFAVIEKIWFAFQYVLLVLILLIFLRRIKEKEKQSILLLCFSLFLFSAGWIFNMDIGQSYLLFPFLWSLPFLFPHESKNFIICTAIVIAIAAWLKPVCILLSIPFLLSNHLTFFIKPFILTLLICISQVFLCEHGNIWLQYFESANLWSTFFSHYDPSLPIGINEGLGPDIIEGCRLKEITPLRDYQSCIPINIFILTGRHVNKTVCLVALFIALAGVCFFAWKHRNKFSANCLWSCGFIMYYLSEILIPINKPAYYFVEFIFTIALLIYNRPLSIYLYTILLILLFLSAHFLKLIPYQLLVAEYFLFALISWSFWSNSRINKPSFFTNR